MNVCFTHLGPLKFRGRMLKQIRTLQEAGHECFLLHGRTEDRPPDYSTYRFPVTSIPVSQERNKLQTFASQLRYNYRCADAIVASGCDAVVTVALQSALCGALAKRRRPGLRFFYDCNELFMEMTQGRLKKFLWGRIERRVLDRADVILHAEQHRLEYFHGRYPTRARPVLLENLPFFRDDPPRPRPAGPARIVYLGGFDPERHCTEIVQAFADADPAECRLDMIGFYPSKKYQPVLEAEIARCAPGAVRVLPPVANAEIHAALRDYDVGLAFYENNNLNNYYCAPNKIYDYIQSRTAIVTNDYPGLKAVVERNGVGVCIAAVTPAAIRAGVREALAKRCADRITDDLRRRYSWEHQAERYRALFSA